MLGAMRILRALGYGGIAALASALAFIVWHCLPARRKQAVESVEKHLKVARPEAVRIARASFTNNFQSFLEIVLTKNFTLHGNPHLLDTGDIFKQAMQEERAVVATTAHIGAWELLAGILAGFRTEYPRIVVVRNQKNRAANELIYRMRGAAGAEVVGHRMAAASVVKALRNQGTTAFLVDHNSSRNEAVFLPFLGEEAAVNVGPALLALRGKAMVYPMFLIRKPDHKYEMVVMPPLDTAALEGGIAEKSRQIAIFYTKAVEDIVRRYPEQWFWMHRRWKTRRPGL